MEHGSLRSARRPGCDAFRDGIADHGDGRFRLAFVEPGFPKRLGGRIRRRRRQRRRRSPANSADGKVGDYAWKVERAARQGKRYRSCPSPPVSCFHTINRSNGYGGHSVCFRRLGLASEPVSTLPPWQGQLALRSRRGITQKIRFQEARHCLASSEDSGIRILPVDPAPLAAFSKRHPTRFDPAAARLAFAPCRGTTICSGTRGRAMLRLGRPPAPDGAQRFRTSAQKGNRAWTWDSRIRPHG